MISCSCLLSAGALFQLPKHKRFFSVCIISLFQQFSMNWELPISSALIRLSSLIGLRIPLVCLFCRVLFPVGNSPLIETAPPSAMQSSAGDDGSFWSRLSNVVFTAASWVFEYYAESPAQEYMDKYHPNAPKIQVKTASQAKNNISGNCIKYVLHFY